MMEKEVLYDVGGGQVMAQVIPEKKVNSESLDRERVLEMDYADIVYIFTDPKKPGIAFYDRTPSRKEEKEAKGIKEGQYLTELEDISRVSWDEKTNIPNGERTFMYVDGEVKVKTIMVSEERMKMILDKLLKCEPHSMVIIDTSEQFSYGHVDNNNYNYIYNNFKEIRDDFKNNLKSDNYGDLIGEDYSMNDISKLGSGIK